MKEVLIDGIRYVPAEPQVDPLEEVKAAHKAGKVIQSRYPTEGRWIDCTPWHEDWSYYPLHQYRIKPEPKPDVVVYGRAFQTSWPDIGFVTSFLGFSEKKCSTDNLRLIFDGETTLLKRAEVL